MMESDGTFTMTDISGTTVLWSAGTSGTANARLVLQNDGNLVLYDANNKALWANGANASKNLYRSAVPNPAPSTQCGRLAAGQGILVNGFLDSCNGAYRLVAQVDANVVLYRTSDSKAMWATGTNTTFESGLYMGTDGNLVSYGMEGAKLWSSNTSGANAQFYLRDDGTMFITQNGYAIWSTNSSLVGTQVDSMNLPNEPGMANGFRRIYTFGGTGGKCVDVLNASTSDSVQIQQYGCNTTSAQMFELIPTGNAHEYFVKNTDGKCLDVSFANKAPSTDVVQYQCTGADNQRFYVQWNGSDATFQLIAKHSGMCLDVNQSSTKDNAHIVQYFCTGGANQKFKM
jgi:hypothetical protein